MILKKGSSGDGVRLLQEFLGIKIDGVFGEKTHKAVKEYQSYNNLVVDGIVGPKTWDVMGIATTDNSESIYEVYNGLDIEKYYLPKGEYKVGPTDKEYLFIHHTAGWHNPYNTIDSWGRDSRGTVATEFLIGGQSIKNDEFEFDGKVLQAFPDGGYGWHLGKNGSQHMHTHSVGVEVNNFGYLTKGGYKKRGVWVDKNPNGFYTYAGSLVDSNQIVELETAFKGYSHWHKYSDAQIESLRLLILYLGERDGIDIRAGLPALVKEKGATAFEWNEDAYYGKVKGVWTHTNTRKDKFDMFPQQELLDMLMSL